MINYKDEIQLLSKDYSGDSTFTGKLIMTYGFNAAFGEIAPEIGLHAIMKIIYERVISLQGASYFQVCKYNGVKFLVIDDGGIVTVLMPNEY